jgi:hypothetical protein
MWQRWAKGQPVAVERLREVTPTLSADRSPNRAHSRLLADSIERWASSRGVEMHGRESIEGDRRLVGPELAL